MKIEFWYDPVNPETMLKLEDRWLDKDDIYGFLYSVQSLPLQNWLYASGSWPGLKAHLSDLTRGEELTLIFFGRECDFEDLKTCLEGMPDLELFFEPWDVFGICKSRLAELPGVVEKLGLPESPFPELACCSIQEETEAGWICSIENETQFPQLTRHRKAGMHPARQNHFPERNAPGIPSQGTSPDRVGGSLAKHPFSPKRSLAKQGATPPEV